MPGTCDSRPTRSPAAATWNGWRDISWHQAVSPRVVGSCRAVSTSARLTPHASAKRIRRSTCLVPDSSSMMFSSRKSRASGSGHSVHGGAPPRELRHVLVVLRRPRAELGARQLALHPLLGERVQPAVPGVDGGLELLPERTRRGHGWLLG